jgi:hypothetical protein
VCVCVLYKDFNQKNQSKIILNHNNPHQRSIIANQNYVDHLINVTSTTNTSKNVIYNYSQAPMNSQRVVNSNNVNNNNNEPPLIYDESIMNWSMKLSNNNNFFLNNNNHTRHMKQKKYSQQQQRSQSRSPLSSHRYYDEYGDGGTGDGGDDDDNVDYEQYFINNNNNNNNNSSKNDEQTEMQRKRLSTTSWGKLKHSKSNSSNLGGSGGGGGGETLNDYNFNHDQNARYKQQQRFEETNQTFNALVPSSLSSPSLFRLFQNSKQILNTTMSSSSSSSTNENTNNNNNININLYPRMSRREKMLSKTDLKQNSNINTHTVNSAKKTTSFSQLRQRSLSSHALSQCNEMNSSPPTTTTINGNKNNSKASATLPNIKKVNYLFFVFF